MTTIPVFTYTVNDVKIESQYEKMTAQEILEIAAARGAIDGKPEDYILQSLKEDDRKYKPGRHGGPVRGQRVHRSAVRSHSSGLTTKAGQRK